MSEQETRAALRAVMDASAIAKKVQRDTERLRHMSKDDRSPVTVADFAAQAIVALHLERELGRPRLVGEEDAKELRKPENAALRTAVCERVREIFSEVDDATVLDAIDVGNHDATGDAYWTLDPIDGTKGFLRNGQYAVSLALIEHGVVTLGVLGCPNLSLDFDRSFDQPDPVGTAYVAVRGEPSRVLALGGDPDEARPIGAATAPAVEALRVCESVESGHSRQDDTVRILDRMGATSAPLRLDSQCKYAVVARGQADAYFRLPTRPGYQEKIWDHAAGMLVAEMAGAVVTDILGRPLDFTHGTVLAANRGIVCAAPSIHPALIDAIAALGIGRTDQS